MATVFAKYAKKDTDYLITEPAKTYHARAIITEGQEDYLSSHNLGVFRECPALYRLKKLGLIQHEDRPAYRVGSGAHSLILEGREQYESEFVCGGPVNEKTGKPYGATSQKYKDWVAEQTKEVLTQSQANLIEEMAAAVAAHREATKLLSKGVAEAVVRNELCGIQCQVRLDWFSPEIGFIDLKTCADLRWFEKDAQRYNYINQFAFYRSVLKQASGQVFPVHVIAVEKQEPYRVGVWRISPDSLNTAATENADAIARILKCQESGQYGTGYEEIRVMDVN